MIPTLLACNGPRSAGGDLAMLVVLLIAMGMTFIPAAATLVLGYVLSIEGYRRRNMGLAIGGAAVALFHLLGARAYVMPLYLAAVIGCLALAAAAIGRTLVLTA